MSGFFKKLFNRVIGKKEEEAPPPPAQAAVALEAPPLPEPEITPTPTPASKGEGQAVEFVAEVVAELRPAETIVETPTVPSPESPSPELTSNLWEGIEGGETRVEFAEVPQPHPAPLPKRVLPKKPEPKKPEPKKTEPKRAEPKTPAPMSKPEAKQVEPDAPPRRIGEPEPVAPPPVIIALEPEPEPVAIVAAPAPASIQIAEPEALPLPESVLAAAPAPAASEERAQRKGWFARLADGLSKSSKSIAGSITSIFNKRRLDKNTLQDLEDVLLQADLGLPMAERIVKAVSAGRYDKEIDPQEVKRILAAEIAKVLKPVEIPFNFGAEKPYVILVVGVNGAGKTTTIGKLGAIARREGFNVMFAACDTFRAAAIEQLTVWGGRIGAKVISRPTGSDASGLAFDAMKEAAGDGTDILFIDTAGRLQNKQYLMDELDKVVRVIKKLDEAAPHAVLLVLDATTGQNALAQAEIFTKVAGVTGLVMTKLDGTARGGILVAIAEKFGIPVHAIGVGETIDDLQPFEADGFAKAIAGLEDE